MKRWLVVLWVCGASGALAEGQGWSAVGGRTVPVRATALTVEAGWPGVDVGWVHGVAPGVNLGLRAGLVYGLQGLLTSVVPGLEVRGLLKVRLLDLEVVSLALTFEPGAFFAGQPGSPTRAGLVLPVGLKLGVAASSAVSVAVLLEVPLWLELGAGAGWDLPLLSGVGVEYFVSSQLALFAQVRLGPTLRPAATALLTLDARLGVAFEF